MYWFHLCLQAVKKSEENESARQLKKCSVQDVAGKVEQIVQGGMYSLSNIVSSAGTSAREGLACVKHPLKFIPCVADVVVYELSNVKETVFDYINLVKTLIGVIVHDILACL